MYKIKKKADTIQKKKVDVIYENFEKYWLIFCLSLLYLFTWNFYTYRISQFLLSK